MRASGNLKVCRDLIKMVRPLSGYMILAILTGTIGHLCAIFIPILGGTAFLTQANDSIPISLQGIFIAVLILAVLRGGLRYGEQACNHFIAFKLLALIRNKMFAALRRLAPAKLEGRDKGNLIAVITSDIELLEVFYAHTISPVVIAVLVAVVMSLLVGGFHWSFGLLAATAYLTVGGLLPFLISKRSGDVGMQVRAGAGELGSFVLDSLRGLPEILQYGEGDNRLQEIGLRTDRLAQEEERLKLQGGKGTAVTNTVILLFDMMMLILASGLYMKGRVELSGVIIPVIAMLSSFGPVIALSNLGSGLQNTFAAGRRVMDILEETPMTQEVSGNARCHFSGAKAEGVSFSYGGDRILHDVNVAIPEQTIVGISGRSGSGKSTLLKLLMRFWHVEGGEILVSDRNIESVNTSDLREMQGLVTQETHLFHDSIANNLRIAKADASQEELEMACRKAAVHEFIQSLPMGYESEVGELGDTLSGGERQRIGLARAFLHGAPFLLLDEPTSNLDSLNESVILRSVAKEGRRKTVVLVSHRASTMRIADFVYNVERGRVS